MNKEKELAKEILYKHSIEYAKCDVKYNQTENAIIDAMIEFKNTPTVDLTELRKEFAEWYNNVSRQLSSRPEYLEIFDWFSKHIQPKQDKESDAVEFAEWLRKNTLKLKGIENKHLYCLWEDLKVNKFDYETVNKYSLEQLYHQFQNKQ